MSDRGPRLRPAAAPGDDGPAVDSGGAVRPAVAGTATGASVWLLGGGAGLLGLVVFLWLSSHRPGPPREVTHAAPPDAAATGAILPPPPPELTAAEDAARGTPPPAPVQAPAVALVTPPPAPVAVPMPAAPPPPPGPSPEAQRRRAPSLVVDFGGDAATAKGNATGPSDARPGFGPSADESFAARVDNAQPERSRATMLRNKASVVPQGAMIPAVLETALNSDLPGFARAVVSRDVRSFDGSTVLIPRGSRVIGQYRSGLALGASRAFVIWTRVLRPDGASIQIGSNGADELGRAGLAGKVDRHFFERFAGSVLLSVISLGQAALTNGNSTQVTIGSSSDAGSIAGAASALAPQQISPTIKVPQGSAIRIFVARDLDFTPVEGDAPVSARPAERGVYLDAYLEPLRAWLDRDDVTDILINAPGEVWVETLGAPARRHDAPELTELALRRLAAQIAAFSHQGVNRENPLLSATLPDGARVQVVAPPATRGGMAVAIRKHVVNDMALADYSRAGAFDAVRSGGPPLDADAPLREALDAERIAEFLALAVRARKNIVVSGGTSTGKTTFLNALIKEIPAEERLVVIEDTPEVRLVHPNAVGLLAVRGVLGEAAVTAEDLLQASLRLRPDRIILGELRGREAYSFLRAVNSGHPGSITTVHADSPRAAIEQIALMVLQTGVNLRREEILDYVSAVVDVSVQLDRTEGRRRVSEIVLGGR